MMEGTQGTEDRVPDTSFAAYSDDIARPGLTHRLWCFLVFKDPRPTIEVILDLGNRNTGSVEGALLRVLLEGKAKVSARRARYDISYKGSSFVIKIEWHSLRVIGSNTITLEMNGTSSVEEDLANLHRPLWASERGKCLTAIWEVCRTRASIQRGRQYAVDSKKANKKARASLGLEDPS